MTNNVETRRKASRMVTWFVMTCVIYCLQSIFYWSHFRNSATVFYIFEPQSGSNSRSLLCPKFTTSTCIRAINSVNIICECCLLICYIVTGSGRHGIRRTERFINDIPFLSPAGHILKPSLIQMHIKRFNAPAVWSSLHQYQMKWKCQQSWRLGLSGGPYTIFT